MSVFGKLLVAMVLALALPVWAQEHAVSDSLSHSGTPPATQVVPGETGHAGAEEEGLGATLVHILSHHLIDSEDFELFGLTFHLPTIHLGSMRFITKHQVWWVIAALLVWLVVGLAARQRTAVPTGMRNVLEILVVFIRDDVVRPNLREKTETFLPYFLTLFTCILFSNLLGLLPWGSTATGNVNVTAGLSICTLLLMVGMGIKENGVGGFLHQFAPPGVPLWLMPLIVIVEIASFMIRPFALTIRLFANMFAGHAVYFVLLGLIVSLLFALPALAVAAGVFLLEIVVALIQSYIFIMLTAVFMGLTMHPSH